jgi:hypothetical protein
LLLLLLLLLFPSWERVSGGQRLLMPLLLANPAPGNAVRALQFLIACLILAELVVQVMASSLAAS